MSYFVDCECLEQGDVFLTSAGNATMFSVCGIWRARRKITPEDLNLFSEVEDLATAEMEALGYIEKLGTRGVSFRFSDVGEAERFRLAERRKQREKN